MRDLPLWWTCCSLSRFQDCNPKAMSEKGNGVYDEAQNGAAEMRLGMQA
jgi:hypothetical protein